MKDSLISVIIPFYNTGESTVKLINKLAKEKESRLEVLCIDDGSTDHSLELVGRAAEKIRREKGCEIKIFSQKNTGAAGARNLGLEKARGDFVIFIDSDDEIGEKFITKLHEAMMKGDVDLAVVGFLYRRIRSKEEKTVGIEEAPKMPGEIRRNYILRMLTQNSKLYSVVNKIFRMKAIKQNKIRFREELDFAEDTIFVLDYLAATKGEIVFINEPLYIYNYGTKTSTVAISALDWKNWKNSYDYLKKWAGGERKYCRKIYIRWRISHLLAVGRSDKSWREKTRFLSPFLIPLATLAAKIRK